MDFTKLSEETIALSSQIGPRQQKLLFDHDFYEDEFTLSSQSPVGNTSAPANQRGPGIVYFLDIGSGSFCVRGLPVLENNLSHKELVNLNRHFEKSAEIHFFPCGSIEVAEIISEQMLNRRYPFNDNGLTNISDPGPFWLLSYNDKKISVFFKSMGFKGNKEENIGAIGDPQILKFWWQKFSNLITDQKSISAYSNEKGCHLELNIEPSKGNQEFFQMILKVLLLGEFNSQLNEFADSYDKQAISIFLNELSHSRQFWLRIEEILAS